MTGTVPASAQTNKPSGDKDVVAEVAKLMRQAEAFEQAGEKLKAARVYELIAKKNPSVRRPLANRMARLYAECSVTNKALEWAAEVMKVHPDPQAFLAGIQTKLGSYDEAAKTLRRQIEVAPSRQRSMLLLWQLGDVYEKQGKTEDARKSFERAVREASSDVERDAAQKRLDNFTDRQRAKGKATEKPAAPPKKAPATPPAKPAK